MKATEKETESVYLSGKELHRPKIAILMQENVGQAQTSS